MRGRSSGEVRAYFVGYDASSTVISGCQHAPNQQHPLGLSVQRSV